MKKLYMLFLIIFMCVNCNGESKKMSETEIDIIFQALITQDAEFEIQANKILDERIKKYHLKNDYATKLQLLISMQEYNTAYALTEELAQQYPTYDEILTIRCVLAKKLLSVEQSKIVFTETIKKLNQIESKEESKSFSLKSNQLLLAILYSDDDLKDQFLGEIINEDFSEYEKKIVEEVIILSESELYEIFGVY